MKISDQLLSDGPVNDLNTVVSVKTISILDWIALALLILGGLNWGLMGLANTDVAGAVLGAGTAAARAVYVVVGLAALYSLGLVWRLTGHSY